MIDYVYVSPPLSHRERDEEEETNEEGHTRGFLAQVPLEVSSLLEVHCGDYEIIYDRGGRERFLGHGRKESMRGEWRQGGERGQWVLFRSLD